jgi:putative transcriptional regulator
MPYLCYESMARPTKDETPVHNRLEAVRTDRSLSRQQLADAVGVHYQTIGYLERGEYSPSLSLALRLADVLEIAIGDVFSLHPWVDEPIPAPTPAPVR